MEPLHGLFKPAVFAEPGGDVQRRMEEQLPVVDTVGAVDIEADVLLVIGPSIKIVRSLNQPRSEIRIVGIFEIPAVIRMYFRIALHQTWRILIWFTAPAQASQVKILNIFT